MSDKVRDIVSGISTAPFRNISELATLAQCLEEETNKSGVRAMDLRVIVKPDVPKEKTSGGIILPDVTRDEKRFGATRGVVMSVGENAFEEAEARTKGFIRPAPGDRVMFGKYAGVRFEGPDGADYLIMNDEDIMGRLEE